MNVYGIRYKSTGNWYTGRKSRYSTKLQNSTSSNHAHVFPKLSGARVKVSQGFPSSERDDLEIVEFELVERRTLPAMP